MHKNIHTGHKPYKVNLPVFFFKVLKIRKIKCPQYYFLEFIKAKLVKSINDQ